MAPGIEPTLYYTWYLTPKGSAYHVVTDEAGKGYDAGRNCLMHRGHDPLVGDAKMVPKTMVRKVS